MGCFGVVWGVTTDPADSDDCAFLWVETHLPLGFPVIKCRKVSPEVR